MRRDHIDDIIISDGAWLKSLAKSEAGCSSFKTRYLALCDVTGDTYWITLRRSERVALGPELSGEFTFRQVDGARVGDGIALVGWSGKRPDGSAFVGSGPAAETASRR